MATPNLTPAFITEWSEDVTHLAEQKNSKLEDAVRTDRDVGAKTYQFNKMGSMAAVARPDGSTDSVSPNAPASTVQPTILANYEAVILIPKFDEKKISFDAKSNYQLASVRAINRTKDDIVIAALGTSTASQNTYATMTEAAVQAQAFYLDSSDVEEEDRVLLYGSQQKQDLMGVEQFSNAFYRGMVNEGEMQVFTGQNTPVLGFAKFIWSNRLPLSGANRICYAFAKYAVGFAIGQDLETDFWWNGDKRSWQITSDFSGGASVIDQAGITGLLVSSG